VLITAAAGGVGHLAVQIALFLGAHVIATTGPRNIDFVRSLGAELVIDYTREDPVDAILQRHPQGVAKILNGVSGEEANALVQLLPPGGHLVDLPGTITATRPKVRIDTGYVVRGDGERLAKISRMIDAGELAPEISQAFAFEDAPAALERVLAKHVRGKIALKID
jgi:NADPH:quinone reductase-like Zn-dependent oxidoreductase